MNSPSPNRTSRKPRAARPAPALVLAAHKPLLQALQPGTSYVSRLSSRGSLYADFQSLLGGDDQPLPRENYRQRVIEENALARRALATRRKLWQELSPRYCPDDADPLYVAFFEEHRDAGGDVDRALTAYLLLALHDRLVIDLGTEWFYPHLRTAPSELRPADVLAFLAARTDNHPELARWSVCSRTGVASHYLSLLKEFGLARGARRKFSLRPACGAAPVRFLLRALLLDQASNLAAVQSPLFRLLGLTLDETVSLLFRLHAAGALHCRIQGDVVDLDLSRRAEGSRGS